MSTPALPPMLHPLLRDPRTMARMVRQYFRDRPMMDDDLRMLGVWCDTRTGSRIGQTTHRYRAGLYTWDPTRKRVERTSTTIPEWSIYLSITIDDDHARKARGPHHIILRVSDDPDPDTGLYTLSHMHSILPLSYTWCPR